MGDEILAGRALSNHWEHAHQDLGGTNNASRSERAADDLLSDGLRRALLATHTYRPPGLDQLFVEVITLAWCVLGHVHVSTVAQGVGRPAVREAVTIGQ